VTRLPHSDPEVEALAARSWPRGRCTHRIMTRRRRGPHASDGFIWLPTFHRRADTERPEMDLCSFLGWRTVGRAPTESIGLYATTRPTTPLGNALNGPIYHGPTLIRLRPPPLPLLRLSKFTFLAASLGSRSFPDRPPRRRYARSGAPEEFTGPTAGRLPWRRAGGTATMLTGIQMTA